MTSTTNAIEAVQVQDISAELMALRKSANQRMKEKTHRTDDAMVVDTWRKLMKRKKRDLETNEFDEQIAIDKKVTIDF